MEWDVSVQITKDVCQLVLSHDVELQHWIVVRLRAQEHKGVHTLIRDQCM